MKPFAPESHPTVMVREAPVASAAGITVRVHYPLERGSLVLRAEPDWDTDLEPTGGDPGSGLFEFELPREHTFAYFKPVIHDDSGMHWARGENGLALANGGIARDVYPYFFEDPACSVCELAEKRSREMERSHRFRVFLPPGYEENSLASYPIVFMQDGQNLFFPDESFDGAHWRVAETLQLLDSMNLIRKLIVVGVYPLDRTRDYTRPGYEAYGRFLVDDLKAWADATYRIAPGPRNTAVIGSSLGGVVSFYLAWHRPDVFGQAACLSSTFGWRDDLLSRVEAEPPPEVRFYLDSGWPRDNYEVTRQMRDLLLRRGFVPGRSLFYLAFPEAAHNERAWAVRLHVPLQFLFGEGSAPVAAV